MNTFPTVGKTSTFQSGNEETSIHSGTPLFQHHEMRTPLYTVELLYSNTLKWGNLYTQWNSTISTPWNEDTSVYSGTPLFQHPEMRTPLYTVELLYSYTLKWGHLCTVELLYSNTLKWRHLYGTPLFRIWTVSHEEWSNGLLTIVLDDSFPAFCAVDGLLLPYTFMLVSLSSLETAESSRNSSLGK